jgi:hypothetical protein
MSRLAHLSTLAAKSTLAKIESHRFFPELAESLVVELESFLEAPGCVVGPEQPACRSTPLF